MQNIFLQGACSRRLLSLLLAFAAGSDASALHCAVRSGFDQAPVSFIQRLTVTSRTAPNKSVSFAQSSIQKLQSFRLPGVIADHYIAFPVVALCIVVVSGVLLSARSPKEGTSMELPPYLHGVFTGITDAVLFFSYGALYLGCATLGHYTRDAGYSSSMLILISTLMKVVLALVLWRVMDGTFADMRRTAIEGRSTLLLYAFPSALYTLGDTLRTHVLRHVDPSTYLVLFNTRMFLLAFVWERLLNRKLSLASWLALVVIFIGCTLKELPNVELGHLDYERCLAYAEIFAIGTVNAIAAVYNERLLKFQAEVPVNLQNLSMYLFGSIWAAFGSLMPFALGSNRNATLLGISQWSAVLLDPLVLTMAVSVAALGVTTGFFLKRLSNIHREVAIGISMVASLPLDAFLFGYSAGFTECLGIGAVLAGVLIFATNPVKVSD